MTLNEGRRVKLATELRLTGTVTSAEEVPAEEVPSGEEPPVVGILSLAAGTGGTVERVRTHHRPPSAEVLEYERLKSLLDDFGHQMPPVSRGQLEERVGALEPEWIAHRERGARVTLRVRLDNGFVLDEAREDLFVPA
ncbi:hypothetical protein [Streptomyces sp. NPDC048606]|uniref:hypothetical protein n=1 Tax=Streptomyces sp. NPDC048606 TaxID=3154726 RepID=UPI003431F2A8